MGKQKIWSDDALAAQLDKAELQKWRKQLNWTQARAAEWLRVGLRSYESWEGGRRHPNHPMGIRMRMQVATQRYLLKAKQSR